MISHRLPISILVNHNTCHTQSTTKTKSKTPQKPKKPRENQKKQKNQRFGENIPGNLSFRGLVFLFFLFFLFFWFSPGFFCFFGVLVEVSQIFSNGSLAWHRHFGKEFRKLLSCSGTFAGQSGGPARTVRWHFPEILVPKENGLMHPKFVTTGPHTIVHEIFTADPRVEHFTHIRT